MTEPAADRPAEAGDRGRRRYTISVAAEIAGVHPQTLRDYESKGVLAPQRTSGHTRMYSDDDLMRVRRIKRLIDEGVNLSGIAKILSLEGHLDDLQGDYDRLVGEVDRVHRSAHHSDTDS